MKHILYALSLLLGGSLAYSQVAVTPASDVGMEIIGYSAALSPADGTTYYLGTGTVPGSVANTLQLPIYRSGTIVEAWVYTAATAGSGESSTLAVRVNNTTDYILMNNWVHNASSGVRRITGLAIPVTAGDNYELKWTSPTWVTNPTNVIVQARLFLRVP